jgi:predicted cupin superfamily sugar epimerase
MKPASHWISTLELAPHPEGGFFRETYRSADTLPGEVLPARFGGERDLCTAILYLLQHPDFSAFHRITSDEIWHHYTGGDLRLHVLDKNGRHEEILVGTGGPGARPQAVVPADCWFASEPVAADSYSLVGCTVAPGFDFADFELGARGELCARWPQHKDLIERLTRTS